MSYLSTPAEYRLGSKFTPYARIPPRAAYPRCSTCDLWKATRQITTHRVLGPGRCTAGWPLVEPRNTWYTDGCPDHRRK